LRRTGATRRVANGSVNADLAAWSARGGPRLRVFDDEHGLWLIAYYQDLSRYVVFARDNCRLLDGAIRLEHARRGPAIDGAVRMECEAADGSRLSGDVTFASCRSPRLLPSTDASMPTPAQAPLGAQTGK